MNSGSQKLLVYPILNCWCQHCWGMWGFGKDFVLLFRGSYIYRFLVCWLRIILDFGRRLLPGNKADAGTIDGHGTPDEERYLRKRAENNPASAA